jgi:hypothetical protein
MEMDEPSNGDRERLGVTETRDPRRRQPVFRRRLGLRGRCRRVLDARAPSSGLARRLVVGEPAFDGRRSDRALLVVIGINPGVAGLDRGLPAIFDGDPFAHAEHPEFSLHRVHVVLGRADVGREERGRVTTFPRRVAVGLLGLTQVKFCRGDVCLRFAGHVWDIAADLVDLRKVSFRGSHRYDLPHRCRSGLTDRRVLTPRQPGGGEYRQHAQGARTSLLIGHRATSAATQFARHFRQACGRNNETRSAA